MADAITIPMFAPVRRCYWTSTTWYSTPISTSPSRFTWHPQRWGSGHSAPRTKAARGASFCCGKTASSLHESRLHTLNARPDRATRGTVMRVQNISEILYRHDPGNTCCNVNEDMEDEYN